MRTYLATLHRRPHHHKKRFALLTSASVTLLIFSIWSLVKFGNDPVIANEPEPSTFATKTISPMEALSASAYQSWKILQEQFGKAFQGLESLDVGTEYYQVRNDALNKNGR